MKIEDFALLQADLERQLQEINRVMAGIRELQPEWDAVQLDSLGYRIHNYYCSWEDLFLIIARHFENHIEGSDRYHIQLLRRMQTTIPGVRPALLAESQAKLLDELRAFRHFFRHAYGAELDPRKLRILFSDILEGHAALLRCVSTFLNHCRKDPQSD
ncbi:MAG: hypothetical protein HS115_00130 [Spirochaetales bacterium]|nr:hypothetical protein [Spirochaetales bacterium]